MGSFADGLKDVFSGLMNKRNSVSRSSVTHTRLSDNDMRVMYKSGLMSKVFRLKVGYALNNTLEFDSSEDSLFFDKKLLKHVKNASKFMLGFGRGIIVVFNQGDDLNTPLRNPNLSNIKIKVFSGDMVAGNSPSYDLQSDRYYKPLYYNVRGVMIHHTRVVDFTYFEPVETEKPEYNYGGISESELVYAQYVNDEVVQRATGNIVDKASTFIYKIKGYKDLISRKEESDLVSYISTCEDGRSTFGALITDLEDGIEVVSQSIADLDKVDNITLRRIAMVTGIGMTDLIGEQPGGLGSSGSDERESTKDTVKNLQSDYLLEPINHLAQIFGLGDIFFRDEQMQSPAQKAEYEAKTAATAKLLWEMGEDANKYLVEKGVIVKNDWDDYWKEGKPAQSFDPLTEGEEFNAPELGEEVNKTVAELSMNGAQVTSLMEIISKVSLGEMPKITAEKIISTAFPISSEFAKDLLDDIVISAGVENE